MTALGLTEDQLRERRSGIGGSDIAAVLGVDPYRTRWSIFADKLGLLPPHESRFTHWGKRLEGSIADEYAERNGVRLITCGTLRHRARSWHIATPDRLIPADAQAQHLFHNPHVTLPDGIAHGLEIKSKGFFQSKNWGDDGGDEDSVPEEVQAQCHWSMALTELPRWDAAALLGGNDYRQFTIRRDVDFEAAMLEVAEQFWRDNVLKKEPPDLDGSGPAWAFLQARLPAMKRDIEATPEAEELVRALRAAKELLAAAEAGKDENTQRLAGLLVDAGASGMVASTWRFSVGSRIGNPAWKSIAEELAARLNLTADELAALVEINRGASIIVPRFTDRTKKGSKSE